LADVSFDTNKLSLDEIYAELKSKQIIYS
jgi:hypothetical protein